MEACQNRASLSPTGLNCKISFIPETAFTDPAFASPFPLCLSISMPLRFLPFVCGGRESRRESFEFDSMIGETRRDLFSKFFSRLIEISVTLLINLIVERRRDAFGNSSKFDDLTREASALT